MSKITKVKRVANNKLQAEMIDYVQRPGKTNVLAKLNMGDPSFENVGKPRYGWFTVTIPSLKMIGVQDELLLLIDKLQTGEELELNIDDPKLDGEVLRLQVMERVGAISDYERKFPLEAAKKIEITEEIGKRNNIKSEFDLSNYVGETGYFVDGNGQHIFTNTIPVIESELNHRFVEDVYLCPKSELAVYSSTLADPVKVETKEKVEK